MTETPPPIGSVSLSGITSDMLDEYTIPALLSTALRQPLQYATAMINAPSRPANSFVQREVENSAEHNYASELAESFGKPDAEKRAARAEDRAKIYDSFKVALPAEAGREAIAVYMNPLLKKAAGFLGRTIRLEVSPDNDNAMLFKAEGGFFTIGELEDTLKHAVNVLKLRNNELSGESIVAPKMNASELRAKSMIPIELLRQNAMYSYLTKRFPDAKIKNVQLIKRSDSGELHYFITLDAHYSRSNFCPSIVPEGSIERLGLDQKNKTIRWGVNALALDAGLGVTYDIAAGEMVERGIVKNRESGFKR